MTFESQYTLNQCKDKITVCWGVGRIFTWVQCLKLTRSHFSVNAKEGFEKSSVAVQIDARIQSSTPFAVHYKKIRIHLREMATNRAKIRLLAPKNSKKHFNQHSITFLSILMRHSAYKREKYTFICANIQVINTILKVNKDNSQTLKCINHLLTFLSHCLKFNSIPGRH